MTTTTNEEQQLETKYSSPKQHRCPPRPPASLQHHQHPTTSAIHDLPDFKAGAIHLPGEEPVKLCAVPVASNTSQEEPHDRRAAHRIPTVEAAAQRRRHAPHHRSSHRQYTPRLAKRPKTPTHATHALCHETRLICPERPTLTHLRPPQPQIWPRWRHRTAGNAEEMTAALPE
jgi:hypothetical protein